MDKITVWYCFDENKMKYIFNHIENDWQNNNHPLPKHTTFILQKRWEKSQWKKAHGELKNNKVVANEIKIKLINFKFFIKKLLNKFLKLLTKTINMIQCN